ncbi:MAG: LysR family transcriptional regulator [Hyphomicrobiales bacterium]
MNVTFRQMRLFLALAETGSVSKAAAAMHVTQPTASAQLREMTSAIGLPLHEVIGKRVYLTDAGRQLAQTARAMLAEWESFGQHMGQLKGLSRGRLRVAAVSTAENFIPRLVGSFCRLHPAIDVSLAVLNRDGVVARLRDNRDDIYIMSMPPDLDLADDVFMENPLVLIAARGTKLGSRHSLAQLRDQRFILREPGSGTRMATDRHFARRRFRPDVRLELGSNAAVREAVAGGLGLGVISRHALQGGKDIRVLDVEGFPISSRWHVVHPRAKQLSPIAAAFRAHLLAHAGRG